MAQPYTDRFATNPGRHYFDGAVLAALADYAVIGAGDDNDGERVHVERASGPRTRILERALLHRNGREDRTRDLTRDVLVTSSAQLAAMPAAVQEIFWSHEIVPGGRRPALTR